MEGLQNTDPWTDKQKQSKANNINYYQVDDSSFQCLNKHPVAKKTTDGTPWLCRNPSCEYSIHNQKPTHQHKYTVVVVYKEKYDHSSGNSKITFVATTLRCESCDSEVERK